MVLTIAMENKKAGRGRRSGKWQSVKAGCCNLNIMVRKGFPEKVTFEQKPKVGEGVNHKGKVWP